MLRTKLGTLKQVNPVSDRIILVDATGNYGDTIYTPSESNEGEYVATTNETGYGTPNLERSQVANYVSGRHKKIDGDVIVYFENYDLFSGNEYKAIINEDGWYQFKMITIPTQPNNEAIPVGEVAYVTDQSTIVKNDSGVFVYMSHEDLYDSSYASDIEEHLFLSSTSVKLQEMNSIMNDYNRYDSVGNRPKITRIKIQFDVIKGMMAGSIYQFGRGNKNNAQSNIEWLNKYIRDLVYGV